jgi:hypothetical protein
MRITFLRETSPTNRTCPTLYATDRQTFLVQGKRITDAAIASAFSLGIEEDVVEVPARLLQEVAEDMIFPEPRAEGTALALVRAVPRGTSASSMSATSRSTFVVRGITVTDPQALAEMDIPDDETAVEVPRELLAGIRADAA